MTRWKCRAPSAPTLWTALKARPEQHPTSGNSNSCDCATGSKNARRGNFLTSSLRATLRASFCAASIFARRMRNRVQKRERHEHPDVSLPFIHSLSALLRRRSIKSMRCARVNNVVEWRDGGFQIFSTACPPPLAPCWEHRTVPPTKTTSPPRHFTPTPFTPPTPPPPPPSHHPPPYPPHS